MTLFKNYKRLKEIHKILEKQVKENQTVSHLRQKQLHSDFLKQKCEFEKRKF